MPVAYRQGVGKQLNEWVREGFLTKIDTCEYGTPLVVVPKKNGELRICGDYKASINKYLKSFNYPIPTTEEIFDRLKGNKYFFQLDLRSAYHQIPLDDKSARMCAWSTHKGIFMVNVMPFGIKPASGIFQCILEQYIRDINGVASFIDNIVGGGGSYTTDNDGKVRPYISGTRTCRVHITAR